MLAAADYGETNGDPPPELELAFQCRRWTSLPEAGGLLDQPAGLMRRMTILENIYNAFRGKEEANNLAEWGEKNPQAVKILDSIYALRKEVRHDEADTMPDTGGDNG
ncbi:MAG: hypothetical protein KKD77_23905 [Gammaproteobacteria bacterium]|nr:hypothetical protein [Gammaproteobacteria bacterium]